ncbi:hypothetical protein PtrM4_141860 [Pyrenophora tritici-repentis]|uniref:HTH psq-type domain-containing protein n=1 Tax=Pyrenophora tritici-repentis TaxID=45151 RepID=A0A834VKZ2_9PLEO|nr:hypothetical protein PtrM4_141860 [Pyrenophora tritici-repentis]
MDPIQKAIEDIESREAGASFSYREVAKAWGVNRTTLARRHQGRNQPHTLAHLILHPHQETELLQYITTLTEQLKDQSSKDVKKLRRSLHHISAQNSILRGEIRGLKEALLVKKGHQKKSYTLQLNNPKEYHGGAVFWSPRKARLYRLQQANERRVKRERLKEVREKERAAKAAKKER